MKKYFLVAVVFCLSASVFAQNKQQPSAADQMHNTITQSLANTEYYDEAHKNVPNAHGVATKDNLTGEAELLRQGIGAPFVENKGGHYSKDANAGNVKVYVTHSTADPNNVVVLDSPVNIPPVSEPVSVSADDIDAMMMGAIGGEAAIKASQNSNYQGSYETAVGQKEEQNFDISAQVASAAKKEEASKKEYEQQQQRQSQQSSNSANRPAKQEPSFWGKLGAVALQGLANTAIEATNYKYGTNIETIGNNNNNSSGGNGNQTCTYDGQTFHGDACQYCILNKPRSSSACNKCCHSLGRSLMQAPIYYPNGPAPGFPPGCYCRFGPTSGIQF